MRNFNVKKCTDCQEYEKTTIINNFLSRFCLFNYVLKNTNLHKNRQSSNNKLIEADKSNFSRVFASQNRVRDQKEIYRRKKKKKKELSRLTLFLFTKKQRISLIESRRFRKGRITSPKNKNPTHHQLSLLAITEKL